MYVSSVYAMSWCGSVMVHNDVDVYDVYVYVDGTCYHLYVLYHEV